VCYEELNTHDSTNMSKTIVPCCSNSFCLLCINRWLEQHQSCPMCKQTLNVRQLLMVTDDAAPAADAQSQSSGSDSTHTTDHGFGVLTSVENNKVENLTEILRARCAPGQNSKIMLFVAFDNDSTVDQWLAPLLNSLQIKWRFMKGNHYTTSAIERDYRYGDLDMLLVNINNYGSGMNCENTTDVIMMHKFDSDIEQQVIGRAQRLGRTSPLNIWYLLFDNEIS